MSGSRLKIISIIVSVFMFLTVVLSLILVFSDVIERATKSLSSGEGFENFGRSCGGVFIALLSALGALVQFFAGLLLLGAVIPSRKKALILTSGSFSIIFCVLAFLVYLVALLSFIKVDNGLPPAKFVTFSLFICLIADVLGIVVCFASMITKGCKNNIIAMTKEDLPDPFIVGVPKNNDDKNA